MYLSLPQALACLCYQVSCDSQRCCPLCQQHAAALPGYPCSMGQSQVCPKTLLLCGGAVSPAAFPITFFMTNKSMNKFHCIFPKVGSSCLGAAGQWEQDCSTGQEVVSPSCTPLLASGDTGLSHPLIGHSQGLTVSIGDWVRLVEEGGDGRGSRSSVRELWERPRRVCVPVGVWPVGEPGRGLGGSGRRHNLRRTKGIRCS